MYIFPNRLTMYIYTVDEIIHRKKSNSCFLLKYFPITLFLLKINILQYVLNITLICIVYVYGLYPIKIYNNKLIAYSNLPDTFMFILLKVQQHLYIS